MDKIWKKEFTIAALNATEKNMVKYLDIEFTNFGNNFLEATMPVNEKTHQPFGLLHGGASVVLAESLGSLAGYLCLEDKNKAVVGQEINANHIGSVRNGKVTGRAEPIHLGRTSQVWQVTIKDEKNKLICVSRMTLAVINV
ncbi:MAG: hotdog fold thioesterase [Chitinophagales bacterium]